MRQVASATDILQKAGLKLGAGDQFIAPGTNNQAWAQINRADGSKVYIDPVTGAYRTASATGALSPVQDTAASRALNALLQTGNVSQYQKAYADAAAGKPVAAPAAAPSPAQQPASAIQAASGQSQALYAPYSTFSLDQANQALQGLGALQGNTVPVPQAQFSTPEDFMAWVQKTYGAMQPLVQAQTDAAKSSYGAALDALRNAWAARGLLASGAAAAAEQQGANQLAQQIAQIQGQAQADALQQALQAANLSLNEQQQLWNEAANNRDYQAQLAQQRVQGILNALGVQNQMNQQAWGQQTDIAQLTGSLLGAPTLAARQQALTEQQQAASNALNVAQLTGRYMPPEAQSIVGDLLSLKYQAENGLVDPKQAQAAADQLRARLAGMGVNPNLVGANVPFAQAVQQVQQLGIPTLDWSKTFADVTGTVPPGFPGAGSLTPSAAQMFQQLSLQNQKLAQDQAQWQATYNLDVARYQQSVLQNQNAQATQGWMTRILGFKTAEDAWAYLTAHANDIINDRASITDILSAMRNRWPQAFGTAATSGSTNASDIPGYLQNQKP